MNDPYKMRMILSAFAALAAACSSARFPSDTAKLGKFTTAARPMKLVLDDDGGLSIIKFDIPISEVPANIRAAMEKIHPGGIIHRSTAKEYYNPRERRYDIYKIIGSNEYEVTFDCDANELFTEEKIDPATAPEPVRRALEAAAHGEYVKMVKFYDAKGVVFKYGCLRKDGDTLRKAQCTPEGKVHVFRRRIPAELEYTEEQGLPAAGAGSQASAPARGGSSPAAHPVAVNASAAAPPPAQGAPLTSTRISGTGVLVEPVPLAGSTPAPAYPGDLRRAGVQGSCVVRALVGEDGIVKNARIETASGFVAFDDAAIAAALQWKFKPGSWGGKAVSLDTLIPFRFSLRVE